jgi:hypothetical protein
MNKIVAGILEGIRKMLCFMQEYMLIIIQWKVKVFKTQLKKWKRFRAQKELDQTYARLGAEIFSLNKGGQKDWKNLPLVEEKLNLVEAAEARLFTVDDEIEEINNRYEERKEELRAKYQMKRMPSAVSDSD